MPGNVLYNNHLQDVVHSRGRFTFKSGHSIEL